jgi:hypothetical protein
VRAVQKTEQRSEKKNHENEKNNFRDSRCGDRYARETENGRDERDNEKSQCPPQHLASSETVLAFLSGQRFTGHAGCGLSQE